MGEQGELTARLLRLMTGMMVMCFGHKSQLIAGNNYDGMMDAVKLILTR